MSSLDFKEFLWVRYCGADDVKPILGNIEDGHAFSQAELDVFGGLFTNQCVPRDMPDVLNVCHCLHTPDLPARGNYDERKYKLYLADTGLLVAIPYAETSCNLRVSRKLGVHKGDPYENPWTSH